MGHGHFLNSIGDKVNFKHQRYVTLSFLKIDMQHQDPLPSAPFQQVGEAGGSSLSGGGGGGGRYHLSNPPIQSSADLYFNLSLDLEYIDDSLYL